MNPTNPANFPLDDSTAKSDKIAVNIEEQAAPPAEKIRRYSKSEGYKSVANVYKNKPVAESRNPVPNTVFLFDTLSDKNPKIATCMIRLIVVPSE